jgi:hypothetical protein
MTPPRRIAVAMVLPLQKVPVTLFRYCRMVVGRVRGNAKAKPHLRRELNKLDRAPAEAEERKG